MLFLIKKIFLLFFALNCVVISYAQDKSNRGKEFWLGYGHNVLFTQNPPVNSQNHVLYLSAEQAATVTVSVNGTAWSQTVNIPANTVDFSITIPKSGADDARIMSEGLSDKGIHVVSNVPIVAYSHQYGLFSSAATMLMPVETFGYTYYSLNYTQVSNYPDSYSWFYVVASEDNTKIQITPSDSTEGGWLPVQTYTVNLNKGQLYNVFGKKTGTYTGKDMSGSKIISVAGADGNCHPVAVFSGSSRNVICSGNGGEVMQQQIFPANAWGTRYVTYHMINSNSIPVSDPFLNIYRVAVRDPATIVKRNGVVLTGLVNNFYYEFSSSTGDYIEADQPILVAQYTVGANQCSGNTPSPYGDPEMIYLSSVEQGVKSTIFYNTRNQAIDFNYVNIITSAAGISSLRIDGVLPAAAEVLVHPSNSNYSIVVKRLLGPGAQHTITCDSVFIASIYGSGITESYGYNLGTYVNNLNAYGSIKNTFNNNNQADSFTCPKSPFRLQIQLAYRANNIHWKLSEVSGIAPNRDSIIANPSPVDSSIINSRKYYTYSLQQDFVFNTTGTYFIPVTYTAPDIDACNQTETATIKVVVKPGPAADFNFSAIACFNDSVYFTGTTSPGIFTLNNYLWTFDDATTQTTINAVKKFITAGNHDVRYRIITTNGCIGDTLKTINLANKPTATINTSGIPCADSLQQFISSFTPGTPQTTWWWDFGDGQTQNLTTGNTAHAYLAPQANIIVKHVVKTSAACVSDTAVTVIPVINPNPVASFTVIADTACINKPVQFNSNLTGIASWNWNFGNGTGTNAPPFNRTYSSANTYTVGLTVTSAAGCRSLPVTNSITINPNPGINAGPDKFINSGGNTTLDATITDPSNYNFIWTPSQYLSAANMLNPVASPNTTIDYSVLAIDKTTNCTATDNVKVNIIAGLYVPSGFTPNRDGKNDAWQIPGLAAYSNALVQVFNRYGEIIYQSKDYYNRPWDGKYKGKDQPNGVFIYIIHLNDAEKRMLKGVVTIIR
jgi:gliding motility-associated-like protein